ncbi:hypothetical protein CR513_55847, partial [Mucuna pruriens]
MEAQISTLATLMAQRVHGLPPLLQIKPTLKEEVKIINLRSGKDNTRPSKYSFPTKAKDEKKDKEFPRFIVIFRELHINILFIEVITQMPNYAKIFKKYNLEEFKVVNLMEECSIIVLKKFPSKLKDSSYFTIPYTIGNSHFEKALYNLGVSINLMSNMACKNPNLLILFCSWPKTITHPSDIANDILVKVGKFIFPANFVILDIEENNIVPIILDRPFFATGRVVIDVEKGLKTSKGRPPQESLVEQQGMTTILHLFHT